MSKLSENELSENELMMLSTLVYYDGARVEGKDLYEIADELSKNPNPDSFQCEMTSEEITTLANAIIDNPNFEDMTVAAVPDERSSVDAACFVDAEGNATVAVKGTGPINEEWIDDAMGAAYADTQMQKDLSNFITENCEKYNDITITGHSKGSNMAQYATIVNGDKIDRCVGFDGQGFNDEFLNKYANEIEANADKITSYSAHNDPINILLNSIVNDDQNHYLPCSGENMKAHSMYLLWLDNQNNLDEDGNLKEYVPQSPLMKELDEQLDDFVNNLDLSEEDEKEFYEFLGHVLGALLVKENRLRSWQLALEEAKDVDFSNVYDAIKKYINSKSNENKNSFAGPADFCVNVRLLEQESENYLTYSKRLTKYAEELNSIRKDLELTQVFQKLKLIREVNQLEDLAESAKDVHIALSESAKQYKKSESTLVSMVII